MSGVHTVGVHTAIVERDEDGWFVGSVPMLSGCRTQAGSIDQLMDRMSEAVAVCLEAEADEPNRLGPVGGGRASRSARKRNIGGGRRHDGSAGAARSAPPTLTAERRRFAGAPPGNAGFRPATRFPVVPAKERVKKSRLPGRAGVLAGMREAHSPENTDAAGAMPGKMARMRAGSPRSRRFARVRHACRRGRRRTHDSFTRSEAGIQNFPSVLGVPGVQHEPSGFPLSNV